jgi:hypothetical protein
MICIMNNARPIMALVYVLEVLRWLLNLPHLCCGRPPRLTLRRAFAIRSLWSR